MYSTLVSQRVRATRAEVYRALPDDDPGNAGKSGAPTVRPSDVEGGTRVEILPEGIPDIVPQDQNETGTRMALTRLAELVEAGS